MWSRACAGTNRAVGRGEKQRAAVRFGRAECGRFEFRGNGYPVRSGAEAAYTSTNC